MQAPSHFLSSTGDNREHMRSPWFDPMACPSGCWTCPNAIRGLGTTIWCMHVKTCPQTCMVNSIWACRCSTTPAHRPCNLPNHSRLQKPDATTEEEHAMSPMAPSGTAAADTRAWTRLPCLAGSTCTTEMNTWLPLTPACLLARLSARTPVVQGPWSATYYTGPSTNNAQLLHAIT
jgi:hypothetical protein